MSCLDSEPDACYLAMHTSRNSFQWRFAVKGGHALLRDEAPDGLYNTSHRL